MNLKTSLAGAIMALGLLAAPASAATFNVAFTQDGLGDSGPDWFGTFEAPTAGGFVTSLVATINGITYDYIDTTALYALVRPSYDAAANNITSPVDLAQVTTDLAGPGVGVLFFLSSTYNEWAVGSCSVRGCSAMGIAGTYVITPSEVPLPAALPLLAAGLGGLGVAGWRRKTVAQKAA